MVLEFAITTNGMNGPTLEIATININNLGSSGGMVTWCESVSAVQNTIQDSGLDIKMYAGIVLPDDSGLSSLLLLNDNNPSGATSDPVTRTTIMDSVITVTASLPDDAGYDMELVQLLAAYITDVDTLISAHINTPQASYNSATGVVSLDTTNLCKDTSETSPCVKKDLVQNGGIDPSALAALEVFAVHEATGTNAGEWLQGVAGTSNPYVAEVGEHFSGQLGSVDTAYWINPRQHTSATAVVVGSSISTTTVVVFGLWKVTTAVGGRRSSRFLLQTVGEGSDSLASASIRLEVTRAGLAASVLGVSPDLGSTWNIGMSVSNAEACQPMETLKLSARSRLLLALQSSASSVLDVQVTSVQLDRDGIDCSTHGARRLLAVAAAASPSILVEALVIFDQDSAPYVDIKALKTAPGILSAELTEPGSEVSIIQDNSPPTDPPATATSEPASNNSALPLIVAVAAGAIALVVAAAAVVWAMRQRRTSSTTALDVAGLVDGTLGEKQAGEITVWMGPMKDLLGKGSGIAKDGHALAPEEAGLSARPAEEPLG